MGFLRVNAEEDVNTMSFTRRQFATGSIGLLCGIGGCSDLRDTESLEKLHLGLSNRTDKSLTFHFALEAADGLGQWHDFDLDADTRRKVSLQPTADREWSGYQAIAGDKRASGSFLGQGDEQACLQLEFRIATEEIAATMSTDRPLCEG